MKKNKLTEVKIKLRNIDSMFKAEKEFCDKIWYKRCYLPLREKLISGKHLLVDKWKPGYPPKKVITKSIWNSANKSAQRVEKKYGEINSSRYTSFEWGMLNGKLSAIRWMLGDDWDQLDT